MASRCVGVCGSSVSWEAPGRWSSSNRRVFVSLPGDRCRPCGPKPREAVAPQRRCPAPGRPGEPLPARGRRHHAPGRRQLPRQAPRRRRPGAPARRPRPREASAALSAAPRRPARPEHLGPRRGAPLLPARALGTARGPQLLADLASPRALPEPASPGLFPTQPLRRTVCLRAGGWGGWPPC